VLKVEGLEVTELKQRLLSRPFRLHLYTYLWVVKDPQAMELLVDSMVVVPQATDTTMKVQAVVLQTSEQVLI
jgi:hypothetical protein